MPEASANWPMQSGCDAFYGDPRGPDGAANPAFESLNLVRIFPPFRMHFAGAPVSSFRFHHKCKDAIDRVLAAIWAAAGHDQAVIDQWGASAFGGSYNFRLMRGGAALSMHSWGCAIDLDPARNAFHSHTPHFAQKPQRAVVEAFEACGAAWGGSWTDPDGMHFQFARVA